jgi:hypothetical protein
MSLFTPNWWEDTPGGRTVMHGPSERDRDAAYARPRERSRSPAPQRPPPVVDRRVEERLSRLETSVLNLCRIVQHLDRIEAIAIEMEKSNSYVATSNDIGSIDARLSRIEQVISRLAPTKN